MNVIVKSIIRTVSISPVKDGDLMLQCLDLFADGGYMSYTAINGSYVQSHDPKTVQFCLDRLSGAGIVPKSGDIFFIRIEEAS